MSAHPTFAAVAARGVAAAAALALAGGVGAGTAVSGCRTAAPSPAYVARVETALRATTDVLAEPLLAAPGGPTLEAAAGVLAPLVRVGSPAGPGPTTLTDSGVYYLALGLAPVPSGDPRIALHVADGSQVVSREADGPRLTVVADGERYGSCRERLAGPSLAQGWLPVLRTAYTTAAGTRIVQESFVGALPGTGRAASFVRLDVTPAAAGGAATVALVPSEPSLRRDGDRLVGARGVVLAFSTGAVFDGHALVYRAERQATIVLVRPVDPVSVSGVRADAAAYGRARSATVDGWERAVGDVPFVVPEKAVLDAERNLLAQELVLRWHYSVGNAYDGFEFPESLENAGVLAEYGRAGPAWSIVREAAGRRSGLYPEWDAASRLLAAGRAFALDHDTAALRALTDRLAADAAFLAGRLPASGPGLLPPERYTADLPTVALGFATQATAWAGLRSMQRAWAGAGRPDLARRAARAADTLGAGLRSAVQRSARRLPDGTVFLPARLLDDEQPYGSVSATRAGSYWNLVIPDALASGILAPDDPLLRGAYDYMLRHGARLLGLVRFNYHGTPVGSVDAGGPPGYRVSGVDDVYALNVARLVADLDRPDDLDMTLYGELAAGMAPGTFVSGEGATVAPEPGEAERSMYLPPNSTSNAAFLEALRSTLLHETRAPDGTATGLELAFATPRAWLAPGRTIAVRRAPTTFGPVSVQLARSAGTVRVTYAPPPRRPPAGVRLRLRLPPGETVVGATVDGKPFPHVDRRTGELDLSSLRATTVVVALAAVAG